MPVAYSLQCPARVQDGQGKQPDQISPVLLNSKSIDQTMPKKRGLGLLVEYYRDLSDTRIKAVACSNFHVLFGIKWIFFTNENAAIHSFIHLQTVFFSYKLIILQAEPILPSISPCCYCAKKIT